MEKLLNEFSDIVVWSKGAQRAPHKPLLILYTLGSLLNGKDKVVFNDIEKPLTELLKEYGPRRKSYHPEYPFWRLQNDGVWMLDNAHKCEIRKGNTDAKITELRKNEVRGYFRPDIQNILKSDKVLFAELVKMVLDNHFPETLHAEIQEACGIYLEYSKNVKRRDPAFREKVLRAYEYRCGICGFRAQMDGRHLALEAAHIKWHAAGGPDIESNGIAMCSLHHKLFDKGAFMLRENKIFVSESLYGDSHNRSFQNMLLGFHGAELGKTVREEYAPSTDWLKWHETEVFKGPARRI